MTKASLRKKKIEKFIMMSLFETQKFHREISALFVRSLGVDYKVCSKTLFITEKKKSHS